jgi:hypothetical protein
MKDEYLYSKDKNEDKIKLSSVRILRHFSMINRISIDKNKRTMQIIESIIFKNKSINVHL